MLLNLKDPESIVAWWQVFPDQHDNYLSLKLKVSPEFAPTIREALRRIARDPSLSGMRTSVQPRRPENRPVMQADPI